MSNQKVMGVEWDFSKSLAHTDNQKIVLNIVDFVGAQITSATNKPWTMSISQNDLKAKISLLHRRQKTDFLMPADKKAKIKKANIRKTRRVTVSLLLMTFFFFFLIIQNNGYFVFVESQT